MRAKRIKRGAVRANDDTKFLGGWVPALMVDLIDQSIARTDLDRSKFMRAALREKLERELQEAR